MLVPKRGRNTSIYVVNIFHLHFSPSFKISVYLNYNYLLNILFHNLLFYYKIFY